MLKTVDAWNRGGHRGTTPEPLFDFFFENGNGTYLVAVSGTFLAPLVVPPATRARGADVTITYRAIAVANFLQQSIDQDVNNITELLEEWGI